MSAHAAGGWSAQTIDAAKAHVCRWSGRCCGPASSARCTSPPVRTGASARGQPRVAATLQRAACPREVPRQARGGSGNGPGRALSDKAGLLCTWKQPGQRMHVVLTYSMRSIALRCMLLSANLVARGKERAIIDGVMKHEA